MKKMFAAILVAILVAAIPATASASGFQMCNQHGMLIPCRTPMPPSSKGSKGTGSGSASGTSSRGGSSSSSTGTGQTGSGRALPPVGIR
jgi:hypothetical protein